MSQELLMATRLWAYRKYAEIPVGAAAKGARIERQRLLKIETGEIIPDGQEIMGLCLVYKCTVKEILAPELPYKAASEAIRAYYARKAEKRDVMAFLGLDLQAMDSALDKYRNQQDLTELDKRIRANQPEVLHD